jgi:hypothetical protein
LPKGHDEEPHFGQISPSQWGKEPRPGYTPGVPPEKPITSGQAWLVDHHLTTVPKIRKKH